MNLLYFFGYEPAPSWPWGDGEASTLASHRLRGALPARCLQQQGHEVHAIGDLHGLQAHDRAGNDTRLLIGKLSHKDQEIFDRMVQQAMALIAEARNRSIPIVVDYCDDLVGMGDHRSRATWELLLRADRIVCSSEGLAHRAGLYTGVPERIGVIPDPVEGQRQPPHCSARITAGTPRLLWFGHSSNLDALLNVFPGLDALAAVYSFELEILTDLPAEALLALQLQLLGQALRFPVHFSHWQKPQDVAEALERSAVVFLPVEMEGAKRLASNNRLTEALWGGSFVVASPLTSYVPFHPCSWLGEDLIEGLRWVFLHPQEADDRTALGQKLVQRCYTPEAIARHWEQQLSEAALPADSEIPDGGPLLNLGCGHHLLEGYLNIDIVASRSGVQPDLCSDLTDLALVPDACAREVLAVHVVEHFWRWQVEAILQEWARVLKPGGTLILECPNLLTACEELLRDPQGSAGAGPEGSRTMWVFYGDPSWQDPLMTHRWGYTPASLIGLLTDAGFVDALREPARFKQGEPRDMRITAHIKA